MSSFARSKAPPFKGILKRPNAYNVSIDMWLDIMNRGISEGADAAVLACLCTRTRDALTRSVWHRRVRVGRKGTVVEPASREFDVTVAPDEDIQAAIDACPPGGCVLLRAGIHAAEAPVMLNNKSIYIFGRCAATITCASGVVINTLAARATLVGLTLVALKMPSPHMQDPYFVVNLNPGSRVRIQACRVDGGGERDFGIHIDSCDDVVLDDVTIKRVTVCCVWVGPCKTFRAFDCTFRNENNNCRSAIQLDNHAATSAPGAPGALPSISVHGCAFDGFDVAIWIEALEFEALVIDEDEGAELIIGGPGRALALAKNLADTNRTVRVAEYDAMVTSSLVTDDDDGGPLMLSLKRQLQRAPTSFHAIVGPHESVQAAVVSCPPGGHIHLLPGVHVGHLVIDQNDVTVWGFGKATLWSAHPSTVMCASTGVVIIGVDVHCGGVIDDGVVLESAAVTVHATSNLVLLGCHVRAPTGVAVRVVRGSPTIVGCALTNSYFGVSATTAMARPTLSSTKIEGNCSGIVVSGGARAILERGCTVVNNTVADDVDVEVMGWGIVIADVASSACCSSDTAFGLNSRGDMGGAGFEDHRRRVCNVIERTRGGIIWRNNNDTPMIVQGHVPTPSTFDVIVVAGSPLQAALDRCPVGGTVLLLPGEHTGPVVINHTMRIFGRGEATIQGIESDNVVSWTVRVDRNAPHTVLDGVYIIPHQESASIAVSSLCIKATAVRLQFCGVRNDGGTAVGVMTGGSLTVQECSIGNAVRGIAVFANAECVIKMSVVHSNQEGVVVMAGSRVELTKNKFLRNTRAGVCLMEGAGGNASFFQNEFEGNDKNVVRKDA